MVCPKQRKVNQAMAEPVSVAMKRQKWRGAVMQGEVGHRRRGERAAVQGGVGHRRKRRSGGIAQLRTQSSTILRSKSAMSTVRKNICA
jgi:hypothetical protein